MEQRRTITHYAERHDLEIVEWYEEMLSAAGRPRIVFKSMMQRLRRSKGSVGLIMHKVDRGARNLRDWADIGDALEYGVDVRLAHDNLDLWTRGGRLTADIQAVMAADYIRNLREEVRKGIEGRLHQGLYPFKAPRGYQDNGRGRAKVPDPVIAPLVVYAFERYASGGCSLGELAQELWERGLGTEQGAVVSPDSVARMLRNPFYEGTVVSKGVAYPGVHQSLVSRELFDEVQRIFRRRRPGRKYHHAFRYRRRLTCVRCGRSMCGSLKKGRVYYRCAHQHPGVSVREDRISVFDPRYTIFPEHTRPERGSVAIWKKFDSPKGIDQPLQRVPINGSVEPFRNAKASETETFGW